jgi:IclR family transcriptional regulator, KDG regulon repressor
VKSTSAKPSQVRVLLKTLDILEAIRQSPDNMALAEVSRKVQMPRPTVYRILTTLESRGYLDRQADGGYRMAEKFFALQRDTTLEQDLQRVAKQPMEKLSALCKETVNLGTLDGGEVVVIATVESPLSIRMSSKIGNRRFAHSTALGKVMLSGMGTEEIERLIQVKGLAKMTPNTITSRTALAKELRKVHAQGYAVDDQENEMDGRCLAAPIKDSRNRVVAALSISAPVFRMDHARVESLEAALRQTCAAISKALQE